MEKSRRGVFHQPVSLSSLLLNDKKMNMKRLWKNPEGEFSIMSGRSGCGKIPKGSFPQ